MVRRPRLGGFELPPPAGARLAHSPAAAFSILLRFQWPCRHRLWVSSSPWGLTTLARPSACLGPGRSSPAPGCFGSRCPPPARGLLRGGRYRPAPRGTRPASPAALASLGTSVSACGRLFCRLARCFAHSSSYCFPSRAGLRGFPIIRCLRMPAGYRPFAGAHAARTPLYVTTVGRSGALPP